MLMQDPEASSSGPQRTEQARDRGAGSGKGDDETLRDIGKLSMAEEKKDDMDVDEGVSNRGSSGMFKSGMCEPKPRDTEAGPANLNRMQFEEYRKTAPRYEYSGEGDDQRLLSTWRSPCRPRWRS